jgi:tRNA/rRNA methyltransferase
VQITFVLVEPAVPENIGAAARALKTMGFGNLALVNPCDHLSQPARWLAHASEEVLENAKVYKNFDESIADFDFVIGTTAKRRMVKFEYFAIGELGNFLSSKQKTMQKIAIVFGREESGLRNEELKKCDIISGIPMKTNYPSLNLGQSVMLYAYELSKQDGEAVAKNHTLPDAQSMRFLKKKIYKVLLQSGFREDSNIFYRYFERIQHLTQDDMNLLHSFCNKILDNQK